MSLVGPSEKFKGIHITSLLKERAEDIHVVSSSHFDRCCRKSRRRPALKRKQSNHRSRLFESNLRFPSSFESMFARRSRKNLFSTAAARLVRPAGHDLAPAWIVPIVHPGAT